jgi:hypothetical protein
LEEEEEEEEKNKKGEKEITEKYNNKIKIRRNI